MKLLLAALALIVTHAGWAAQLQVTNEAGQPIAGAEVYIGSGDAPIITDVNGSITIPEKWNTNSNITIKANGFLKATFLQLAPQEIVLQLSRADSRTNLEIKGITTNYTTIKRDGKVDYSLVYPALTRRQIAQFDVSSIVSSEFDTFKVVTETVSIPSNIALPEQKETFVLPITLDKPIYRMTLRRTGNYRMVATHGQFPLNQVINDIRSGKSFYEVVNHFKFLGGGQREVTVNGSMDGQDIPVNQIAYDSTIALRAPNFGDDKVMFSASMVRQGDLYFTSDVKRVIANETINMAVPSTSENNSFVNLLISKADLDSMMPRWEDNGQNSGEENSTDGDVISPLKYFQKMIRTVANRILSYRNSPQHKADETPYKGAISMAHIESSELQPQFLGFTTKPVATDNTLILTVPAAAEGVEPVATVINLAEVEKVDRGNYNVENVYKVWELSQSGWVNTAQIPIDQLELTPGKTYRWEVLFTARKSSQTKEFKQYFMDDITHVSRNSFDFVK